MIKAGLDIGYSKISCVIADYKNTENINILSIISVPNNNIKKNIILNFENLHDQIIQKFKTLPKLLTASPEKLYEVEGIGRSRAQQLRDYFDTLLKNIGFSYINGH